MALPLRWLLAGPDQVQDLVDFTVSIRGVEVGVLFIEQARGGIKLSVRSRTGLDCAALVSAFGGGGHKAAAGAFLKGSLTEVQPVVLDAVREAMR